MKTDIDKMLSKHRDLIHSDNLKVESHVQRTSGDWVLNTLMIHGYEVPFKYKRNERYKNLEGTRVNLTYYPATEKIAGMEFEVMNVVRVKRS